MLMMNLGSKGRVLISPASSFSHCYLQIAAIEAIDRTLHRRGHLSIITGQPLHPLRRLQSSIVHPNNGDDHTKTLTDTRNLGRPGPTILTAATGPSSELISQSIAAVGPSKRPAVGPAVQEQPKMKKAKVTSSLCRVCGQTFHLVKDCPVVSDGTQRSVIFFPVTLVTYGVMQSVS